LNFQIVPQTGPSHRTNERYVSVCNKRYALWDQIEREANLNTPETKLLHSGTVLYFGDLSNKGFKSMIDQHTSPRLMNAS